MRLHTFLFFTCIAFLLGSPAVAFSWGPDGHRIVGVNAVALLDSQARAAVIEIIGDDKEETIGQVCSWPDSVREMPEWNWSAPQHYVNIPRNATQYVAERDCADGLCVTAAILKYANTLTQPRAGDSERWQALAWLCHLVGDLHQPLHAGFRDDLGGNTIEIEYRGETGNLHQFWDRVVIQDRLRGSNDWDRPFSDSPWVAAPANWNPVTVQLWTDESHALAASSAYPDSDVVPEYFADQTWLIIRQQWQKASIRLAGILNATLGKGEVLIDGTLQIPGDSESDPGFAPVR